MSFVRAKEIPPRSGNWYDYLVECRWENGKPRQKIIRYLGKKGTYAASGLSGGGSDTVSPSTTVTDVRQPATPPADTSRIPKMKTPARQIASALGMYYGGMSLDAIQQQFKQDHDLDMSETNYWDWVKRFTREAVKQAKDFKPEVGE